MVDDKALEKASAKLTLDDAVAMHSSVFPGIWKRFNTKHVESPGNFYGYRAVPVSLCSAVCEAYRPKAGAILNIACAATLLEKYDFPTYYVSGPLLDAMKHTNPPSDMRWSEIDWPFPAVLFMVPRGHLFEPDGNEIVLIGVAKLSGNIEIPFFRTKSGDKVKAMAKEDGLDRVCVFWSIGPSCMTLQDSVFPADQRLIPDAEWIDKRTQEWEAVTGFPEDAPKGEFSAYVAGILANLLLVKQARVELMEKGCATGKRLKSGLPVHSPTWLGRSYTIIKKEHAATAPGAKGHYSELGWRSGYHRVQHYGPRGEQTKTIWIDPYIAFTKGFVPAA